MVAPGNEDEERIDDPYAVFLKELWYGAVITNEFLDEVIDSGKWADGTPETPQEQKHDRDNRPPQHPGQRRTKVIMCGGWPEQQFKHDDH